MPTKIRQVPDSSGIALPKPALRPPSGLRRAARSGCRGRIVLPPAPPRKPPDHRATDGSRHVPETDAVFRLGGLREPNSLILQISRQIERTATTFVRSVGALVEKPRTWYEKTTSVERKNHVRGTKEPRAWFSYKCRSRTHGRRHRTHADRRRNDADAGRTPNSADCTPPHPDSDAARRPASGSGRRAAKSGAAPMRPKCTERARAALRPWRAGGPCGSGGGRRSPAPASVVSVWTGVWRQPASGFSASSAFASGRCARGHDTAGTTATGRCRHKPPSHRPA